MAHRIVEGRGRFLGAIIDGQMELARCYFDDGKDDLADVPLGWRAIRDGGVQLLRLRSRRQYEGRVIPETRSDEEVE